AGYLEGTIIGCYTSEAIEAANYAGGIVGYGAENSIIMINYADSSFFVNENVIYIGGIAGDIAGFNAANMNFGIRVAFNYFIGETINGIRGTLTLEGSQNQESALNPAKRITPSELKMLPKNLGVQFQQRVSSEYPAANGFIGYTGSAKYINLFDTSLTSDYQIAFIKEQTVIAFMVWNGKGDVDNLDSYELMTIQHDNGIYPGSKQILPILYTKEYEDYLTKDEAERDVAEWSETGIIVGEKASYFVKWVFEPTDIKSGEDNKFYAQYTQIITSVRCDVYAGEWSAFTRGAKVSTIIIEGQFPQGLVAEARLLDAKYDSKKVLTSGNISIRFSDGEAHPGVTVKYKELGKGFAPENYTVTIGTKTVETSTSGEYIKFRMSGLAFKVEKNKYVFPGWAIALIVVGSVLVAGCVTFVVLKVLKKKKGNAEKTPSESVPFYIAATETAAADASETVAVEETATEAAAEEAIAEEVAEETATEAASEEVIAEEVAEETTVEEITETAVTEEASEEVVSDDNNETPPTVE
ncbi:MAG: hypothetical protein LBN25_00735, partial [Christensenellaceae bacterium]|nr:hypothetical protein [Christensenellaceae bacterium]